MWWSWVPIGLLVVVSGWAMVETNRLLELGKRTHKRRERTDQNRRMFRAVGAWELAVALCMTVLGIRYASAATFNYAGVIAVGGMGLFFLWASRHPWVLSHDWGDPEEEAPGYEPGDDEPLRG